MNKKSVAQEIVRLVGGEQNIETVNHCMTRIRFVLKDSEIALNNAEQLQKLNGVLDVINRGGQFQIVLGHEARVVYDQISSTIELSDVLVSEINTKSWLDGFTEALSTIFFPIIPAIAGAGVLKGLLELIKTYGLIGVDTNTFIILQVIADAVFYFLPILLAFSAAMKFQCNQMVAVSVAAILLHPTFNNIIAGGNVNMDFLGIPFIMMNYATTVVPILIGIWVMSHVERFIKSWMPKVVDIIFTPLLTLLLVVPFVLIIIGPLGILLGDFVSVTFSFIYGKLTFVAGAIFGAFYPLLVLGGLHYSLLPIMLQNISTKGYDVFLALAAAGNTAVAGAVFGVYLKSKIKSTKALALSATISGLIGIIEPGLYSFVIKSKQVLLAVFLGGAAGGVIMGIFQVRNSGFGLNPLGGLPVFFGDTFIYYILGVMVAFIVSASTAYFLNAPDVD